MAKYFYFNRTYNKNGQQIVSGAVKIYLRKPYGSQELATTRDVTGQNGQTRTVCNVEGSVKLDQYMVKQLGYFFNVNLAEGSYLNVRVGLWGPAAKALSKFNLNEGDAYMFILSNATLSSFNKKDGSVGYQVDANAFDFEHIPANPNNAQANGGQNRAQPATNNVGPTADDFAAIDESEDLPF